MNMRDPQINKIVILITAVLILSIGFTVVPRDIQVTKEHARESHERYKNAGSSENERFQPTRGILPTQTLGTDTLVDWSVIIAELGLDYLHSRGFNGSGVKIGFIDNGIDSTHPAFEDISFLEQSFAPAGEESSKTHGTPVAGVVVGYTSEGISGSAPGADIISAAMGSDSSDVVITGNFTKAMLWLASQDVSIINTSFGGVADWSPLISIAKANNITLVGSAGNDGLSDPAPPPTGPAIDPYGIAVGALDSPSILAPYSQRGPTADLVSKPDTVAFGTVKSTSVISGASIYTGTSFASPLVTGGIASVLSALFYYSKEANPGAIKAALLKAASPVSSDPSGEGSGFVNFTRMFEILNTSQSQQYMDAKRLTEVFSTLPQGLTTNVPLQFITDDPLNDGLTISGNGSSMITYTTPTSNKSHTSFPLSITTSLATGWYQIIIDTEDADSATSIQTILNITVGQQLRGRIGVDLYHDPDYVSGSYTLREDNGQISMLRDNWFWPVGITDVFDTDILDLDMIILRNIANYKSSTLIDNFSASNYTTMEYQLLDQFVEQGGHVVVMIDSPRDVDGEIVGSQISQINEIIDVAGLHIPSSLGDPIGSDLAMINNRSSYGQSTASTSHKGFEITGGQSLYAPHSLRGLVANRSGSMGSMVVSTDISAIGDTFLCEIVDWLFNPAILTHEFSADNNPIITFDGNVDTEMMLEVDLYHYNGTLKQRSSSIVNLPLQVELDQLGLYTVHLIGDSTYYQLHYDYYPTLIRDINGPSLELIYPAGEERLYFNQSSDQLLEFHIRYHENYQIDKNSVYGEVNSKKITTYIMNSTHIQVLVLKSVLNSQNTSQGMLRLSDSSGNVGMLNFTIFADFPGPIAEASSEPIVEDPVDFIRDNSSVIVPLTLVLVGIVGLYTVLKRRYEL